MRQRHDIETKDKGEKNTRESAGGCEILNLNVLKQSFGFEYQLLDGNTIQR